MVSKRFQNYFSKEKSIEYAYRDVDRVHGASVHGVYGFIKRESSAATSISFEVPNSAPLD
jgi:hypothetical protein